MKKFKKVIAFAMAAALTLSMAVTSFAAANVPTSLPGVEGVPGEFGAEKEKFTVNGVVYTNYEGGCQKINEDGTTGQMYYGGGQFDKDGNVAKNDGAVNFLAEKIGGQEITGNAHNIIGTKATDDEVHALFKNAFLALGATNIPGVTVSAIDEWNKQVKLDLRFGDSTAVPFNWQRAFMTTLFLSSDGKAVYPVRDGIFMAYKDVMNDIGAPASLPKEMMVDGTKMTTQVFDNGIIVIDENSFVYPGEAGQWPEGSTVSLGIVKMNGTFTMTEVSAAETTATTAEATSTETKTKTENPATGDSSNALALMGLFAVACGFVLLTVRKKATAK